MKQQKAHGKSLEEKSAQTCVLRHVISTTIVSADDGFVAMFVVCDVAIYDSQSALFRKVWEKWRRIDVVVANAGVVDRDSKYMLRVNPSDPSMELSHEQPDTTCTDVNLKGCIYTIQLATD
jgi:NAD(P)-dependent dehydrogenase (short-subunit alcohol dehydrogenase family)